MSALLRFPGFKYKAFTLSYDDGSIHDIRLSDTMAAHGVKGTFNINSANIGKPGRLTADQVRTLLLDRGMEVAAHGERHLSLAAVDSAVAMRDVINDRVALEKEFGIIIKGMAYANGAYDDNVVDILKKCGVWYSRTTISTEKFDMPTDWLRLPATCHHNNPRLMELAKKFVEANSSNTYVSSGPKLFYLWGHSYEFDRNDNWNVIEQFASYIGKRDDIWYATSMQIYEYVSAYDSLVFSADERKIYNPSLQTVWMYIAGNVYSVKPGETITVE